MTTYRKGNVLAIALGHGKTDWVKNVLAAGEADLRYIRRDVHITNPRILPAGSDGHGLPLAAAAGDACSRRIAWSDAPLFASQARVLRP